MQPPEQVNAVRREYTLRTWQKCLYLVLSIASLIVAVSFFKLLAPIVCLFLVTLGLFLAALALRSRLTLDGNRIEVRSALRTFAADRNEIEGLRGMSSRNGRWTRLYLAGGRAFSVSDSFAGCDDLDQWLKDVPDLDERDAAKITEQLRSQNVPAELGTEQRDLFKQAKRWAIILNVAAGCAGGAALLLQATPLNTVLLILLSLFPLLGIFLVRRFPLLFTLFKRKVDPRADIGIFMFWSGIALMVSQNSASNPVHVPDISRLTWWVLLVLAGYVLALIPVAWNNPQRWGSVLGLLFTGGLYGVGLINIANTMPDRSTPQLYRTTISDMYETHGKNASGHLRLAPWGPLASEGDVAVPTRLYQEVNVGDQICIELHAGFLHAPWYILLPCPDAGSNPPE